MTRSTLARLTARLGRSINVLLRYERLRYCLRMPTCKSCGDEVESLVSVNLNGKARKLCEDCAEMAQQQAEIAEQSEGAVQEMMGFTGCR